MTWDELVVEATARHPLRESRMFGMPCLKRENGKVVAGHWKDGGLTVKLTDESQREAALALPGAEAFDPSGVGSTEPPRSGGVGFAGAGAEPAGRVMKEWVLVPESQSADWVRLVDEAVG